ncbi:MAG: hypothetical protein COW18_02190 [Zetaproteobacteria bacterium CG12_big_fil_rev_8_21_14_0_65_54_13]|nr:MAG: hypothetical protein COX55_08440 [Zetaproteobacteria bacterium CG23_combo_of_CG06-09_8_20_14_all_54_7]PIW51234.1 MAG: hypothetical protein COW18_02190 [Zetaproteobacteria bacterium CG12_big_fil_rev_8_21_14_0_65_54_13]PIX53532.1 MAG: hypothetical protein COZ50_12885 [Zetaproteobacteria bacterium CG_4_10_14_3_um_filter_54_28]PJA28342.1 MAG: hypothetical protein CO188_09930 [Zetaproteobacteria bacterium CG_4_9_14_3_um_filter_54_145]
MAISVQSVDGLIYRLLQQNSSSSLKGDVQAPEKAGRDSVDISSQARDQQPMHSVEPSVHTPKGSGGRSLESHLLSLYKSNN